MKERTIFLHGFSKAFAMTGFRIGYACGPAELIEAMMKVHQYSMLCAPILSQEAAIEALVRGEDAMKAMREQYHRRRDLIVRRLNEAGLACHRPGGAFYAFPSVAATGLSDRDFAYGLLEAERGRRPGLGLRRERPGFRPRELRHGLRAAHRGLRPDRTVRERRRRHVPLRRPS
jgi:aminotransferase